MCIRDRHTFFVIKELYHKVKSLLVEGNKLFIEGVVKAKWHGGTLEMSPISIRLMETISEAYFKSITLKIPVDMITNEIISKLELFTHGHVGNQKMNLLILDSENKIALPATMFSKVLINQLLIELAVANDLEFDVEMN